MKKVIVSAIKIISLLTLLTIFSTGTVVNASSLGGTNQASAPIERNVFI